MARMPGTVWVGEQSPRIPMDRYDIVCVHTIVGYAPAHAAHFSTKADGTILQSRDTAFRSAANLNGNHRVIAIENEDHGPAFARMLRRAAARRADRKGRTGAVAQRVLSGVPPLTPKQVEANAQILAWASTVHGVPLQLCPNSRPTSQGLAYHRQGIDGNFAGYAYPGRVPGGEVWTEHFGKLCPADARIAQLPEILARARAITSPEEDFDMNKDEAKALFREVLREELGTSDEDGLIGMGEAQPRRSVAQALRDLWRHDR